MADTQINVGMNVDGVITGTDKAKRKIGELGGAAREAGRGMGAIGDGMAATSQKVEAATRKIGELGGAAREAGRGTGAIGDGMAATSQKVEAATKSLVSSIQRTTALMDAGARGSAEYYKALANQRGVDANTLKPYLDQLEAVKVKQSQAAAAMVSGGKSLDNVGISAQQTAAALRGVPAQLTDIVVSLQGGQAPMTVLLQQGGQLKDMFGGIGPAARALGGYVMGMVNPFTAAAAAGATLAVAAYQGAQESKAFTDTLITTGNQAGVTAGRLMLMAQSLDSVAGTQGNAAAVLNQLAATGQVTAAGLQLAAQAAIEFERAGGQAAEKTVQGFAELGKAPLAATIKLNESMGYLTRSTYEQIKSLEEQGRTADAAALAQKAFADALLTRAPEMLANMGYLETGWVNIKDAVKEAWDGIKNIGRDAGVEGQSASVGAAIARLEGVIRTKTQGGYNTQMFDAELAKLKERQSILQSDERLLRSAADHQAQQTREVEARVKWDKDGAQYLDKKVKMEREITQAISEGTKAKATQADIDARVAAIREKYKEKAGPKTSFVPGADNAREWETYMKAFGAAAVDAEGKVSGLTKTQGKLIEYLGSGAYLNMPEPARQTALQAAYAAIATEQQVEATKHQAQAWTEANKSALAYGKQLDDMALAGADLIAQATSYAAAIDQQVAATEFEASLIGQSNVQRGIALKQYQIELETKKEIARINATLASQADRDAAISAVKAAGDKAKASAAAEVVNQEFNRVSAQIEQSLTDALMRGFESGKGFAETLRDTVANMFKTLVLRPIVSAVVNPVAGAITAGLGLPGAASAATTGANAMSGMGVLGGSLGALGTGLGAGAGMIAGGGVGGWLSASTSLIGTGTAAGAMAGIGALAGPIGAALAVASLIKGLDDSGTMHTGGLGSYSAARGSSTGDAVKAQGLGFDLSSNDYNAATAQASVAIAQAVAGMLDSTAATFGQKAGYFAATAWADDTSDDGGWGALMVKLGDQVLLDWKNGTDKWPGREFSDGEAGAKEYAAAVATDVRDYLITQTPAWADTMLTALGDAPSLEQLAATVGQINATATALDGMGQASAAFAGMTEAATSALIAAMGGAEASVASLSGYYTNFYTESERTAIATATLTGQLGELGQVLPASREAFRGLVDAAIAAGDTTLAAGLINLQDEFSALVPAANNAASAVSGVLTGLQGTAKSLQREIIELQGGDLRAFDTQGFTATEVQAYDFVASLTAVRDGLKATQQQAAAVATERDGLNRQLLEAMGDTAAIRALELAALDASNRAIQEHIWAIQDAAAAYERATTAAQSAYGTLERSVDAERSTLNGTYDAERQAISARLKAQQEGYQAQIAAAQNAADTIRDIASALSTAVGQVRVDSPSLNRSAYDAARSVIGTGNINDPRLKAALDAVSGDNKQFYGRFEDYAFEQAVTAANIRSMDAAAQSQLSAAEAMIQSLKASDTMAQVIADAELAALEEKHAEDLEKLQAQLDLGKSQLDALLGIDTSVLSVADAVAALSGALGMAKQAASQVASGTPSTGGAPRPTSTLGGGSWYDEKTGSTIPGWDALIQQLNGMTISQALLNQEYAGMGVDPVALPMSIVRRYTSEWTADPAINAMSDSSLLAALAARGFDPSGTNTAYATEAARAGYSPLAATPGGAGSLVGTMTQAQEDAAFQEFVKRTASFDVGINRVPRDMFAKIHEGEAIVPAHYNPYNPGAQAYGNDEVVAQLRQLNERMARIEASNAATAGHTAATDRKLARVIKNDAITTEAAT